METLDYHVNLMAGSLRRRKTKNIGIIIPDSSLTLFAHLTKILGDFLFEKKYNSIICSTDYKLKIEIESLNTLRSKMIDGLVIIPARMESKHIEKFIASKIPIIILDRKLDIEANMVIIDNYHGGFIAAEHLVDYGHKLIGYIDRHIDHSHSIDRKRGFFAAMEKYGIIKYDNFFIRSKGLSYEDGYNAAKKMLKQKRRPTAIFGYNDNVAVGVVRAALDLNLKIPKELSIIGYDDMTISNFITPRLTTIHYPVLKMAKATVELLLSLIDNTETSIPKTITVQPRLIIRETTAKIN